MSINTYSLAEIDSYESQHNNFTGFYFDADFLYLLIEGMYVQSSTISKKPSLYENAHYTCVHFSKWLSNSQLRSFVSNYTWLKLITILSKSSTFFHLLTEKKEETFLQKLLAKSFKHEKIPLIKEFLHTWEYQFQTLSDIKRKQLNRECYEYLQAAKGVLVKLGTEEIIVEGNSYFPYMNDHKVNLLAELSEWISKISGMLPNSAYQLADFCISASIDQVKYNEFINNNLDSPIIVNVVSSDDCYCNIVTDIDFNKFFKIQFFRIEDTNFDINAISVCL